MSYSLRFVEGAYFGFGYDLKTNNCVGRDVMGIIISFQNNLRRSYHPSLRDDSSMLGCCLTQICIKRGFMSTNYVANVGYLSGLEGKFSFLTRGPCDEECLWH